MYNISYLMRKYSVILLSILSAVGMTLAFPSPDLEPLAWVALVPFIIALHRCGRFRCALGAGYLFGVIHWGCTTSWIGDTVVRWAGGSIGWLAWVGLTLIEAWWYALFAVLAWLMLRRKADFLQPLGIAALWVTVEWLRGLGDLSMPWALLGYTQFRFLPLIQIANLLGVYGVSFLIVHFNVSLACWVHRCESGGGEEYRKRARMLLPSVVLIAIALLYGWVQLDRRVSGERMTVAVMQPNIHSERHWVPNPPRDLALFQRMMDGMVQNPIWVKATDRLVIWPESIAPGDAINDEYLRSYYKDLSYQDKTWQVVGTEYEDDQGRPYNSAAVFSPEGKLAARYDKNWLVPFGEWIPWRRELEPFSGVFRFFSVDDVAGHDNAPVAANPAKLCILICYETAFPSIARARVALGANLLVSITNDSWAGHSKVQWQHAAMGVFRAVETGKWFAASSTTGVTFIVDPRGRVESLPRYEVGWLVRDVTLPLGETPYVRWGGWEPYLFILIVIVRFGIRGGEDAKNAATRT